MGSPFGGLKIDEVWLDEFEDIRGAETAKAKDREREHLLKKIAELKHRSKDAEAEKEAIRSKFLAAEAAAHASAKAAADSATQAASGGSLLADWRAVEEAIKAGATKIDGNTVKSNIPSFATHGNDEIDTLKKRNAELEAENAALRGKLRDAELKANSDGW